ncbi:hypothetical protein [Haloarchaeobius salinus]|uniref:hypothetical protein n=1 Tax=Haloarchaeobius salinus TaxID=1198298 RepID=UPI0021093558|nr:hypothetical protein [Haloarchaeobius salinus]
MPSRRTLLAMTALAAPGTAGCLDRAGDDVDGVAIDSLTVHNDDDSRHHLAVELHADGETVARESRTLGPRSGVAIESPVDGPDDYVLDVGVDDQTARERLTDHASDGQQCVIPVVTVATDGRLRLTVQAYDDC